MAYPQECAVAGGRASRRGDQVKPLSVPLKHSGGYRELLGDSPGSERPAGRGRGGT
jgi:hypothetical protein